MPAPQCLRHSVPESAGAAHADSREDPSGAELRAPRVPRLPRSFDGPRPQDVKAVFMPPPRLRWQQCGSRNRAGGATGHHLPQDRKGLRADGEPVERTLGVRTSDRRSSLRAGGSGSLQAWMERCQPADPEEPRRYAWHSPPRDAARPRRHQATRLRAGSRDRGQYRHFWASSLPWHR